MGGGGKSSTSTQSVSIPPEVLARYNAVNARAEDVAQQPFQQYGGEFVAPLNPTQQAGIQATSAASQLAQPYYGAATQGLLGAQQGGANYIGAATGAALAGAAPVSPQGLQVGRYMNPFTQSVVGATQAAMGQQQGQQLAQQQAEAIRAGAYGGDRAGLQRQTLRGQQSLAQAQAIAPLYQQGYQQALQTAQQQQGVGLGAEQANRQAVQQLSQQLAGLGQQGYAMGAGASQQLAGLGTGAQQAALQGAQAQIGAGTLAQQTQQAQDTAQYQQFLQERGYPFQVAQFLANIAMGTGALSGSTTTTTQPRGFFSNRGGFKTGESLQRSGKAYGGGLDPNSMGGAVYQPGAFERGGYATAGSVVDPNDLSAILAQQRQSFGPFAAAGPYGQAAGATPHGPSGIVPQQQLATPKLVTAGPLSKQTSGGSDVSKGYSLLDEASKGLTGKGVTQRIGEKAFGKDPTGAVKDESGNILKAAQPAEKGFVQEGWDKLFGATPAATGGGILPRHHYADGGSEDSQADEAIPYDPSDVQGGKDPMEGVLKAGSQKHEMLKPAGGGGSGGGGSKLGLGKAAGSMIGTAIGGPIGGMAGGFLGNLLPFEQGGVVPRQHFDEGGDAEQPVRKYFDYLTKEKGYEPHVAAGILGNAYHESGGLQPNIVGDQGKSIGLFQFHERGEQPAFRQWASENQRSISDPYAQIDFVHNQLQGPYAGTLEQMRAAKDPSAAAESFMRGYERPKEGPTAALDRRQAYANAIASGEKLPTFRAYAGNQGGLGGAGQEAIQRATSGEGKGLGAGQEQPGFFDRNKGIILPVLQGIGAMASSKSISPWAAALQGLGAGAKAYGDVEAQQAVIDQTKAQTFETMQRGANLAFTPDGKFVRLENGQLMPVWEWFQMKDRPTTIGGPGTSSAAASFLAHIGIKPTEVAGKSGVGGVGPQAPTTPETAPVAGTVAAQKPEAPVKYSPLGGSSRELARGESENIMGWNSEGARAASNNYLQTTQSVAQAANQNSRNVNELANVVAQQIASGGIGTSGTGFVARTELVRALNTLGGALGGRETFSDADSRADLLRKLGNLQASDLAKGADQRSLGALNAMIEALPQGKMTRDAQAQLTSQIMIANQAAKDRENHRIQYGQLNPGLNAYSNAGQAFENDNQARLGLEQELMKKALLTKPNAVGMLTTGKATPEQIEEFFQDLAKQNKIQYTPGMYRYFPRQ